MQPLTYLTALLLVAASVSASSQPEQAANSPSVESAQSQAQSVVVETSHHSQPQNVVVSAEQAAHHQAAQQQQLAQQVVNQAAPVAGPQYYYQPSPAAGMITVVGEQPQQQQQPSAAAAVKPVVGHHSVAGGQQQVARSYEQYGQPESASLPPNYKPFGSWGLYIGGNPADGYYTNYYKALSNSVAATDKQQQPAGEQLPAVSGGSPSAGGLVKPALSPMLRQASSSPYVGADYYPFAYSPSELSSASRADSVPPPQVVASQLGAALLSPVQVGAQVYGSPAVYEPGYPTVYADAYATKRLGAAYATKSSEAVQQKEVAIAPPAAKGYQSRVYVYPATVGQLAAPSVAGQVHHQHQQPALAHQQQHSQQQHQHHQQQSQVVAYPVPIGSQIVGSQAGVDGAFAPYGVHAFTRYAVKPTVVSQAADSGYYYGLGHQQPAAYRLHQQVYQPAASSVYGGASYYPHGGYYGYPMNQLHYSHSLFPVAASSPVQVEPHHVPVQPQSEPLEKLESEDKSKQQQKRA